jgi:hypothetical protein
MCVGWITQPVDTYWMAASTYSDRVGLGLAMLDTTETLTCVVSVVSRCTRDLSGRLRLGSTKSFCCEYPTRKGGRSCKDRIDIPGVQDMSRADSKIFIESRSSLSISVAKILLHVDEGKGD